MQNILQAVTSFFAPKPVQMIKAVNDCGEERYIEISRPTRDRREYVEILLTKCKRLMSFVTKNYNSRDLRSIIELYENVRQKLYTNEDIHYLYEEFDLIESKFKKSSKSIINLSDLKE